jgi:hypothetical protein
MQLETSRGKQMSDQDNRRPGQDRREWGPDDERRGAADRGGPPGGSSGNRLQADRQAGGYELSDNHYGGLSARGPQDPHAGQSNPDPARAYANSSTGGHFGYDQNGGNYPGRDASDDRGSQGPGGDLARSGAQHRYGPDRGGREEGQGGYASANNPDNHLVEMPSPELYSQYGLARQDSHGFQREWRKERYNKFSEDFNSWRSKRSAQADRAQVDPGPATVREEQARTAPVSPNTVELPKRGN